MKNITLVIALLIGGLLTPAQAHGTSAGYLKVFTSTQEMQWGEGSYYYPHTGYVVYRTDGTVAKRVENQDSIMEGEPQQVELAPGTYTVWGPATGGSTRVTIKPAQVTEVRL